MFALLQLLSSIYRELNIPEWIWTSCSFMLQTLSITKTAIRTNKENHNTTHNSINYRTATKITITSDSDMTAAATATINNH